MATLDDIAARKRGHAEGVEATGVKKRAPGAPVILNLPAVGGLDKIRMGLCYPGHRPVLIRQDDHLPRDSGRVIGVFPPHRDLVTHEDECPAIRRAPDQVQDRAFRTATFLKG